jgi:hypothetical protein
MGNQIQAKRITSQFQQTDVVQRVNICLILKKKGKGVNEK